MDATREGGSRAEREEGGKGGEGEEGRREEEREEGSGKTSVYGRGLSTAERLVGMVWR